MRVVVRAGDQAVDLLGWRGHRRMRRGRAAAVAVSAGFVSAGLSRLVRHCAAFFRDDGCCRLSGRGRRVASAVSAVSACGRAALGVPAWCVRSSCSRWSCRHETFDRAQRDPYPARPVPSLVRHLVHRLVEFECAQQHVVVARIAAGALRVAGAERVAVALCPFGGAIFELARLRVGRRAGSAPRSRTTATCRRRRASGLESAVRAAIGAPGSPSKSSSTHPASVRMTWPRWKSPCTRCNGNGVVAGRRERRRPRRLPGRDRQVRGRRSWPRRVARASTGPASPRACSSATSVGSACAIAECTSAVAMPSRSDSAAKSPPTSSACRSPSANRSRTLVSASAQPSDAGAQELLEQAERARRAVDVALDPALQCGRRAGCPSR